MKTLPQIFSWRHHRDSCVELELKKKRALNLSAEGQVELFKCPSLPIYKISQYSSWHSISWAHNNSIRNGSLGPRGPLGFRDVSTYSIRSGGRVPTQALWL
jgi:hypothetical protein